MFVDEELNVDAEGVGFCGSANHFLLVTYDDVSALHTQARQGRQIAGQQRLTADLNEAFGAMLGDGPEPLSDSGRQNDGFHGRLPISSSKASRNSTNCCSVSAPILAMRKMLCSR